MSSVVEVVTSWPAALVFVAIFASLVLIAFVAFKFGGKFRLKVFGSFFQIEHDGKADDSTASKPQ